MLIVTESTPASQFPSLATYMITTFEMAPSPALSPYVKRYVYREFDTHDIDLIKPKHAVHEIAMHFFFEGMPVKLVDTSTGKILKTGKRSGISGMSSQYVGEMTFNGFYSFFEIAFPPHGFHTLFKIPSVETINQILWSEEIFDASVTLLHEQLSEANNLTGMAAAADDYLLSRLCKNKQADYTSRMGFVIHSINNNFGLVNVGQLAYKANMSLRNFERYFTGEIGVSPKLFCCITRFNHALNIKLRNPTLEWTSVAHQCGYFDQMHLIKDFKKFSGEAPASLLKHAPLFKEEYVSSMSV